ncbi:MAG: TIGR03118 family protein, partial [Polyangiaceae bacterium]|nr:TIGR03118 family protein [Polyangiaceae bacterium]
MKKIHWLSVGVALVGAAAACSNTADPQARSTDTSNLGTAPSGREDGGREPVTPPPVVQSLAQTNIVASDPSVGGTSSTTVIDPTLVNAWGLAFNPRGAAWISANGSGIANAYDPTGRTLLTVTIPAPTRGQSAPTGQVFNQDAADFSGDSFLFSTEDGTIAGWQTSLGGTAALRVDNSASGAVYKGLAIVNTTDLHAGRLYATNFHAGTVDVWDTNYAPVATTGGFTDPNLPSGFAPFNVAVIERDFVLVTYALQNAEAHDDVAGPGNGFVNVFDLDGRLMTRLISQGELNSPWGLAQPPETFG